MVNGSTFRAKVIFSLLRNEESDMALINGFELLLNAEFMIGPVFKNYTVSIFKILFPASSSKIKKARF